MMMQIRLANALRARIFRLLFARRFARFGEGAQVVAPIGVERPDRITIGDNVYVAPKCYLAVQPIGEGGELIIGHGCKLGRFNHLYATGSVTLGQKVLTANGVYISDNLHDYRDVTTAVMDQPLIQLKPTSIGDGSWIGHNACVVGASIGRHCVVGANAVVTRDAPDYCVIVGAPGRIIRRFDTGTSSWRATEPDGTFSDN